MLVSHEGHSSPQALVVVLAPITFNWCILRDWLIQIIIMVPVIQIAAMMTVTIVRPLSVRFTQNGF